MHTDTNPLNDSTVAHIVAAELRRQARALLDKPATHHATVLGYANAAGDLLLRARELDPEGA